MTLSTRHLRQLNLAILMVHGAPSLDALAAHMLHALRLAVPGDIRVADFSGIAEIRAYTAYDPAPVIPADVNAAVLAIWSTTPCTAGVMRAPPASPIS